MQDCASEEDAHAGEGRSRLTEPKTRGSRRQIRLTSGAVEALERHRERQEAEGAAAGGKWNDWSLVFCTTSTGSRY
jgi:hypothetical protein